MILNSIFSKIVNICKSKAQNSTNAPDDKNVHEQINIDAKTSSQAIRNNFIGQNNVNLKVILSDEEKEKRPANFISHGKLGNP